MAKKLLFETINVTTQEDTFVNCMYYSKKNIFYHIFATTLILCMIFPFLVQISSWLEYIGLVFIMFLFSCFAYLIYGKEKAKKTYYAIMKKMNLKETDKFIIKFYNNYFELYFNKKKESIVEYTNIKKVIEIKNYLYIVFKSDNQKN